MSYRAILCDPPWRFETWSANGRDRCPDARHYECMTVPELMQLPVRDWADKDCLLFLWVTDPMLETAFDVAEHWGFAYSTVAFYWVKCHGNWAPVWGNQHPIGTGYWTRANPEQCLLFKRGSPKRLRSDVRKLIVSPRREHSRKPDELYERIERLVEGPYLELFARTSRQGWDAMGNQAGRWHARLWPSPGEHA